MRIILTPLPIGICKKLMALYLATLLLGQPLDSGLAAPASNLENAPSVQSDERGTTTILIFDTSETMAQGDISGSSKLQAAQNAGYDLLDVISTESTPSAVDENQVGVVQFNTSAYRSAPISSDLQAARQAIGQFSADGGTAMADGLKVGLDMLSDHANQGAGVAILLTDGKANVGLGGDQNLTYDQVKQQVLDLAKEAGKKNYCIYTVGLGVPEVIVEGNEPSLDEDFLRQIPVSAGCGEYYNAQDAKQLADIYIKLRHVSTGEILLEKKGTINQNEEVEVGGAEITAGQDRLLLTLNWPGSRLELIPIDPIGRQVDRNYPGASINATSRVVTVLITNPMPGYWKFKAVGVEVPKGTTTYNLLASARKAVIAVTKPASLVGLHSTSMNPIPVLLGLLLIGGIMVTLAFLRYKPEPQPSLGSASHTAKLIGPGNMVVTVGADFTIGRTASCQFVIANPAISRRHARIRWVGDQWYLQDLGSAGGTRVNGHSVQAANLNSGDRITIGNYTFIFQA